jgi:hypothetical protein
MVPNIDVLSSLRELCICSEVHRSLRVYTNQNSGMINTHFLKQLLYPQCLFGSL